MNEQQLQQILTIQQAIAAAATAAMINTLLNPQQAAANLVNQNANTESPTTPNADFHDQDLQDGSNQTSPAGLALNDNNNHHNQHHHNNNNQLHLQHHQRQDNSVAASLAAVSAAAAAAAATGSNMMISPASSQSPNNNNNNHSNKKLKRHNQAPQAFSRQHNSPGSSSAFLPNNVGLPRKLVRGQDVWLGRGAEQTRQILKCMWCNQSFRTLAEMTQHMKITQHYTNIISQEQITSWKQPEGSEGPIPSGRQHSKQSISSKNLDEFNEVVASASEKSIDSERDDSFSNDEANTPPPQQQPPQLPQSKRQHRTKARPERTISSSNNNNTDIKSPATTNSSNNNNTSIANAANNENNTDSNEDKSTNEQQHPADLGLGNADDDDDDDSESNDENKCKRESASREDSQDNEDDCDKKTTKKRQREEDSEADANTNNTDISVKQELEGPIKEGGGGGGGVGGSGDPLSALETMVEKSFDPRMRPGVASGGILQRLGIDEEVCPPWQHLNYANWYAAAAYGHPMAAALLAAGMNLQNGIKLSKNMGSKKNDD